MTARRLKTRIEDVRRADLVRAAYLVLVEHGLVGITVARVAERVGMSHGIVSYYFRGKNELLRAVMRHAFGLVHDEAARALATTRTPRERVAGIVRACLGTGIFSPASARAWLSLYGLGAEDSELARLQRLYYARLHSNLVHALKQDADADRARRIARGIAVLIDGMWVRQAVAADPIATRDMVAFILDYVDESLQR